MNKKSILKRQSLEFDIAVIVYTFQKYLSRKTFPLGRG